MAGDHHRHVAAELLAARPHDREGAGAGTGAGEGEELLGAAPAWVARVNRTGHVLFVGRHRHLVALTDRRLVTWRHPQRLRKHPDTPSSIDVPLSALRLRGEHAAKPFFQVLASLEPEGDRAHRGRDTLVLELRHRDHAFARALGRALAATPAV